MLSQSTGNANIITNIQELVDRIFSFILDINSINFIGVNKMGRINTVLFVVETK